LSNIDGYIYHMVCVDINNLLVW